MPRENCEFRHLSHETDTARPTSPPDNTAEGCGVLAVPNRRFGKISAQITKYGRRATAPKFGTKRQCGQCRLGSLIGCLPIRYDRSDCAVCTEDSGRMPARPCPMIRF